MRARDRAIKALWVVIATGCAGSADGEESTSRPDRGEYFELVAARLECEVNSDCVVIETVGCVLSVAVHKQNAAEVETAAKRLNEAFVASGVECHWLSAPEKPECHQGRCRLVVDDG